MRKLPFIYPTIDDTLNWLHEEAWSLGYTTMDDQWMVLGFKCGLQFEARGDSLEEAVARVGQQIRLHGILPVTVN